MEHRYVLCFFVRRFWLGLNSCLRYTNNIIFINELWDNRFLLTSKGKIEILTESLNTVGSLGNIRFEFIYTTIDNKALLFTEAHI